MKFFSLILAFVGLAVVAAPAEELWNLSFKDLPAGQTLAAAPFVTPLTAPNEAPQKVSVDDQNKLVGGARMAHLTDAVLFEKGSTAPYLPSLMLAASSAYESGTVTIQWDFTIDHLAVASDRTIETLVSFGLLSEKNTEVFLTATGAGHDSLHFSMSGIKPGSTRFSTGQTVHAKAVLDLGKHSLQVFLNGISLGDPIEDGMKFSSFRGVEFHDGTALGGNYGGKFTAEFANILIMRN